MVKRTPVGALVALLTALLALVGLIVAPSVRADESTISVDNYRTGWDPNEPALHPAAADFGQLFQTHVGGAIFAQPLVVTPHSGGKVLIVATESNTVAGLDPATGAVRWTDSLGPTWPQDTVGCGNGGIIGVTSTPVYDPVTGRVYVMSKTMATDPEHPFWRLHALNPRNGNEPAGWPVTIQGHPDNDPTMTFNSATASQRAGLLLLGGVVYAGFASYCDAGPYVGYIAGVSTTTATQTALWSDEQGTKNGEAGIWQSGGGLVSDGPNEIVFASGNGAEGAPSPGHQPPGKLGEAVVRLHVESTGKLTATDYFSPVNNTALNTDDTDLGSGAPMAIPGTYDGKHLIVEVGKDGRMFLLDADNLGGNAQGPGGTDDVLGVTGPFNGIWGHPAYWAGPDGLQNQGGYVYDVENQGYLRAYQLSTTAQHTPVLSSIGTSAGTFGYTSGSPVVTSDGTAAGSALVWTIYSPNPAAPGGQLRAYDAIPHNGVLSLEYQAPIGTAEKFTVPATDADRVYVGNHNGDVYGFGTPTGAPVEAAPTSFGSVPVGDTSAAKTVTVTATRNVTVTGVHASTPFTITSSTPTPDSPATVAAGDTLPVSMTFSPTATGEADSSLEIDTSDGEVTKTVYLDLYGNGTHPGLAANPASLGFGTTPTHAVKTFDVNVINTSDSTETIETATLSQSAPSGPFSAALPAPGAVSLAPSASLAIPVTYAPTMTSPSGGDTGTLTLTSDGGPDATPVSVALTGSSVVGAAALSLSPNPLLFGTLPVGSFESKYFTVRNTGNIALTITKAPTPAGEFTTATPIAEGTVLSPGEGIRTKITFRPSCGGQRNGLYYINTNDGQGPQQELFEGNATGPLADYYHQLGGQRSMLGPPAGAEKSIAGGCQRAYRHGRIYWSPSTGAHALTGPVLRHYRRLGGPSGFAGFPITDVRSTSHGHIHYAKFSRLWTHIVAVYRHGTHEVHGGIAKRWKRLGGLHSRLGYPVTDEYGVHGLRRSRFHHGAITYDPRTMRTTVTYR